MIEEKNAEFWDAQPLGVETDAQIANRTRFAKSRVRAERIKRGILPAGKFGNAKKENKKMEKMNESKTATSPIIPLLNGGYIQLIETWGSDERIIETARMSTDGAFRGWGRKVCKICSTKDAGELCLTTFDGSGERFSHDWDYKAGDERLLKYLYENKHSTPFEFCGITVEVKAPLFVFRQWHRHRTQAYNEQSARYAPMPDDDFLPTVARICKPNGKNKQANGSGKKISEEAAAKWIESLVFAQRVAENTYREGLNIGVPREIARVALTSARFSKMRATASLRNWLGFMALRSAPDAQEEIRAYSDALNVELCKIFPRTMTLFNGGEK